MILSRRPAATGTTPDEVADEAAHSGKGRPTPKRADARKARRNVTPKNRKEAAALQRERSREQRTLARQALVTGDERHLPPRDAGPEKRLARDIVDSRFTLGQALFGVILFSFVLAIAVGHVQNRTVQTLVNLGPLVLLTAMAFDGARNGRRAKFAVMVKYGDSEVRGISSYAFMRSLLPRRFRRPPPKVDRGAQVL